MDSWLADRSILIQWLQFGNLTTQGEIQLHFEPNTSKIALIWTQTSSVPTWHAQHCMTLHPFHICLSASKPFNYCCCCCYCYYCYQTDLSSTGIYKGQGMGESRGSETAILFPSPLCSPGRSLWFRTINHSPLVNDRQVSWKVGSNISSWNAIKANPW